MKHTIKEFRIKIIDCMEGNTDSRELGEFSYEAWHELNESKQPDETLKNFLSEISSEWGFLLATSYEPKFKKEFLGNLLIRLEKYMNIKPDDEGS